MLRIKVGRLTGMLLVLALLLTGCSASSDGAADPAAGAEATTDGGGSAETASATIATVLTTSGFAAVFGQNQQRGVELAVEQLSEQGIAELEIVASEDAGQDNSTALNAYRRAVGAGPDALIGPIIGTMILAMRPDLARDGLPMMTTSATRSITLDDNEWVFRNFPHSGMSASANAQFAFDELGMTRPAILADNTAFGQDDAAVLVQEAKDRGIEVVANESTEPDAVDVTGQVSRIVRSEADAVFVQLLTGSPLAQAIRTLRDAGFEGAIFAAPGLTSPSTLELLTDAEVIDVYSPGLVLDREKPEVQDYIEAFKAKFGDEPDIFSAVMYDTVMMLGEVVRSGASGPDGISEGLGAIEYEGITTKLRADTEGNLAHTVDVLQFDDAKTPSVVASFDIEFEAAGG
jgi:branched-chain amino acid transport system substrate-binding protein